MLCLRVEHENRAIHALLHRGRPGNRKTRYVEKNACFLGIRKLWFIEGMTRGELKHLTIAASLPKDFNK